MSVRQAQREIDSREFAYWRAKDVISPIGGRRLDRLAALLCHVIVEVQRTQGNPTMPTDFMPEYGPREQPSRAEIAEKIKAKMDLLRHRRGGS